LGPSLCNLFEKDALLSTQVDFLFFFCGRLPNGQVVNVLPVGGATEGARMLTHLVNHEVGTEPSLQARNIALDQKLIACLAAVNGVGPIKAEQLLREFHCQFYSIFFSFFFFVWPIPRSSNLGSSLACAGCCITGGNYPAGTNGKGCRQVTEEFFHGKAVKKASCTYSFFLPTC